MMAESYVFIYFFSTQVNQHVTIYLLRLSSSDVSHSFFLVSWSTFLYEKLSDTKFWIVENYFSAHSMKRNAYIKSLDFQRQRG